MNNTAFKMLSQISKTFNQPEVKIQSHLLSACLLENIHDHLMAKNKIELGMNILEKEQYNIDAKDLKNIATTLTKLNRNNKASQLLISANQQESSTNAPSNKIGKLSNQQLNIGYAARAQEALNIGKQLYAAKEYDKAINSLTEALHLFPHHNGIKLNLLQILLGAYENNKLRINELQQAKKIILGLINLEKDSDDYTRFRKMKIKYQQLTGS